MLCYAPAPAYLVLTSRDRPAQPERAGRCPRSATSQNKAVPTPLGPEETTGKLRHAAETLRARIVSVNRGNPSNPGKVGEVRVLTIGLLVVTGLALTAGCAGKRPAFAPCQPRSTPALLFDRYGGTPTAGQMAVRSDWPSTPSLHQLGESIYYRERFIDIQGAGPHGRGRLGYTYRRFDTLREGSAVR